MRRPGDWDEIFVVVLALSLALALIFLAKVALGAPSGDPAAGDAFTGKGVNGVSRKTAICAAALALSCGGGVDGQGLGDPGRAPMLVPGVDSAASSEAAAAADSPDVLGVLVDGPAPGADLAPASADAGGWPLCAPLYSMPRRLGSQPGAYDAEFCDRSEGGMSVPFGCIKVTPPPAGPCVVLMPSWTPVPKLYVADCSQCPPKFDAGGAP